MGGAPLFSSVKAKIFSKNLIKLAQIHGTDKWGRHRYAEHYQEIFRPVRRKPIKLLEIGVGGHDDPTKGGASLRMWKRYFSRGSIYGVDLHDKKRFEEKRIRVFQGSQTDEVFLASVCKEIGPLDIVIDDGSHVNSHVITSFRTIFPFLKDGGVYAIEDTQTAYWPAFGGTSENFDDKNTTGGFFKSLTDGLNYEAFLLPDFEPDLFQKNIVSIQFFHELIVVRKGRNPELMRPGMKWKFLEKSARID